MFTQKQEPQKKQKIHKTINVETKTEKVVQPIEKELLKHENNNFEREQDNLALQSDEAMSTVECIETEEANRRFAVYHKQTETHLKQEKSKYKTILEDNAHLNKLVERLTAELSS